MEVTRCTWQKIESPQLSRKRTLPEEPALTALWVLEASAINNWILLTPRKDLGQPWDTQQGAGICKDSACHENCGGGARC